MTVIVSKRRFLPVVPVLCTIFAGSILVGGLSLAAETSKKPVVEAPKRPAVQVHVEPVTLASLLLSHDIKLDVAKKILIPKPKHLPTPPPVPHRLPASAFRL
jgi:hypothetical protein